MPNEYIQLTTEVNGATINVHPVCVPEFVNFPDGKTLLDKMNTISNTHVHDKATASKDGFMSKEDYAKLNGLTNYSHPANHPASIIAQDANNRFVSDAEKIKWNNKAENIVATTSTAGLLSPQDKQKIDTIDSNFNIVYDSVTETINFRFK